MNIEEWMRINAAGYADLPEKDLKMIEQFSLLWGLFEHKVLKNRACVKKITKKVIQLNEKITIDPDAFSDALEYFRERYSTGGSTNHKFKKLRFGDGDRKELVEDIMTSRKSDTVSVVQSLLIIAYRLRNNLFHGNKWDYRLRDQADNFQKASIVLIKVIDLQRR